MNKEELLYKIATLEQENKDLKADYGSKAQVERDLLQMRIDKAINLTERLIQEYKLNYGEELSKMLIAYNTLLEILKGDSSE